MPTGVRAHLFIFNFNVQYKYILHLTLYTYEHACTYIHVNNNVREESERVLRTEYRITSKSQTEQNIFMYKNLTMNKTVCIN